MKRIGKISRSCSALGSLVTYQVSKLFPYMPLDDALGTLYHNVHSLCSSGYVGALFFVFVLGALVQVVDYCFARYDEYAVSRSFI